MRSAPVLGAVVCAEDVSGNIAAGTVTRASGRYEFRGLSPGPYQIRVSPVDPRAASYFLFRGADMVGFESAEVNFLATTNTAASVGAGLTATLNFILTPVSKTVRIGRLMPATADPSRLSVANYPSTIPAGAPDMYVGVYSSRFAHQ